MTERDSLRRIRRLYGPMIEEAAAFYRLRPEVLAAIMQRETAGGTSPLLDVQGPGGRGDGGHGHGLCQIDDRSFPEFCASKDWKDPRRNIMFGARVLDRKRAYITAKTLGMGLTDDEIERAACASYNAGEGIVTKMIREGRDVDERTAHHNYSREVLRMAAVYAGLPMDLTNEG